MKKQVTILLASVCAFVPAALVGIPAAAQVVEPETERTTTNTETNDGGGGAAATPAQAEAAGERIQRAYRTWRGKLDRYGVFSGRDLVVAARAEQRPATARELRSSIQRMQKRLRRFLASPEGRAARYAEKVRAIPSGGRRQLAAIAACESHGNPRAVGGGGTYRGMYQFSFSTWQVVGGSGDPAAAPRAEQTWRAWLLLSRHGAGHWPVCG